MSRSAVGRLLFAGAVVAVGAAPAAHAAAYLQTWERAHRVGGR